MAQRNQSKFVTDREVDDPLVQNADFELDADDRQYIDNQIRGIQEYLVEEAIPVIEAGPGGGNAPAGDEDDAVGLDGAGGFKSLGPVVELPSGLTTGDLLFWNGTTFARLAIGTVGQVLTVAGGLPTWATLNAYDPADRTLHVWVKGSFTASPWNGETSAGISATVDFSEATNPPAAGTAVNGATPALFDGTNDKISTEGAIHTEEVLSCDTNPLGGYLVAVMFKASSAPAAQANAYNDPALVGDGTSFSLGWSDGGVGISHFEGAWNQQRFACSSGAWHVVFARCNITTGLIAVRLDNGSFVDAGFTAIAERVISVNNTYRLIIGQSGFSGTTFPGEIMQVMVENGIVADAVVDDLYSYFKATYPAASLP
jgi:hypothetical protein